MLIDWIGETSIEEEREQVFHPVADPSIRPSVGDL